MIHNFQDGNVRVYSGAPSAETQNTKIHYECGQLSVYAERASVRVIELVWQFPLPQTAKLLGDAWERGYGELEWRSLPQAGEMPWYFLIYADGKTTAFGVKTQPNALCWWTADGETVTLHVDISCGADPVQLNGRRLCVCEVVTAEYDCDPFEAAQQFCRTLCDTPRLPEEPVYGGNDWYCNYGESSFEKILTHAKRIAACAPKDGPRPYMVVDDGWELCLHNEHTVEGYFNGGPWRYCNRKFGDMQALAQKMKALGVKPGLWFRPLLTTENLPDSYILKHRGTMYTLDPSVPEVLEVIKKDVRCFREWGYQLLKHDFSTFDLFGKWGFEPGFRTPDVHFTDRTKTTAEIIKNLYAAIREAAGDEIVIIGCNTMSHLSAGFFEIQRTGDDTSGEDFSRTRKMGVNTLAFRMPQHEAFYACDADCVGITRKVPWALNKKWLDVLSKSGTPLFVSIADDAFTPEVQADITAAFVRAAKPAQVSKPPDWMEAQLPRLWESTYGTDEYDWQEGTNDLP